ncbi:MAG: prolyl oligopeptidase family serine peptidase, partial [Bacteroidales bacterium]|nr:prolyl oligopeptidase family serine peptidase [Bacteroidales bacterium]
MKRILLLAALIALPGALWAQKKPLDHDVYDSWQAVSGTALSPSGKVVTYAVNPQEGDGTLYIRIAGKKGARTLEIPRGYQVRLTDNDRYAVCLIKPEFQKTRRAKIKKLTGDKLPQDTLAVIDLTAVTVVRKFPNVKSYQMGLHATEQFAFSTIDTSFVMKEDKDKGTTVAVYRFADGNLDTLRRIDKFAFSKDGRTLGLVQKTDKKHSVVGFYADGKARMFTDTATFHAVPTFNEEGTEALYLQAKDTASTGSKHAALWLYDVVRDEARELVAADQRRNMPENWGLTENSTYRFSKRLGSIYAGIQEYVPVKDTNLVSFETAGLDIWKWDADEIPPRMKANLTRDKQRTYPCLYQDEGLIPFNTNKADRLIFTDNYDAEVILEVSPVNTVESQWNTQGESILTLIFPGSGRRQEIARGAFESTQLSPKGKYAIWWDYPARGWKAYDVADERLLDLTAETVFWNEKDDHPMLPEPYGIAAWTKDDESVILNDRYDLWRIHLSDGKATRLTQGREQKRTYRYVSTKDSEDDPGIGPGETIYLRVFDEVTKENGLASCQVDPKKLNFKTLAFGGYTWDGLRKAKDAPVFAYQKGNLQEQMDLYVTDFGKTTEKLTAINPQQKDYNWATVELYHWLTYDGKTLDGLLFKPEDFDASKKYPVMIYFYETFSENMYKNIIVQPSWSTVNLLFYASRGYIVFVPDIVYTPGMPGQSAYNCIVSGAESLTKFPWVDKDNMAIQGQSWGGYEVAWLITRTNMFKAAGAGAPVSNMTSAYGGIRWESGMSRQFQYEQTQSRIGKDLWNGLELYMENSPLFRLPNVQTPVLIMHND